MTPNSLLFGFAGECRVDSAPAWEDAAGGGGGGALDGLSDVTITSVQTNQVLKYDGSEWINQADATGGGGTTTVTMATTTATVIDTIAWNSFKALEYTIHITNGSNIQAQKLLVMCDGTASSDHHTEYGVMYSSSLLGTFSTATDGSEVNVKFTATNSFTTTVKFIKQVVV